MKWKIGNVVIKNQVVLAPMAGVCNVAFRSIVKDFGCGLIYAEMVSDKALAYNNQKTLKMLEVLDMEKPLSMQVFGSTKESILEGAKIIDANCNCDIIDINMGCPVNKVVKNDGGAKLLLNPEKIYEIVKAVVQNVSKPVTVKIRTGWDKHHIYAKEIAILCEKAGASAIAVHGRTRSQMYDGVADLDIIKEVVEAVSIPVIGNGDITSKEDALHMLTYTKCKAVMIGRGALGNPFLIKECVDYLGGKKVTDTTLTIRFNTLFIHAMRLISLKGEKLGILEMRSHASWYLKGLKGASKVKREVSQVETFYELKAIIEKYKACLEGSD